ncbi:DUF2797 domain-containing protein [Streptomyces nodosus]|uniref:DUF2797 domain-containing protein n=1 Tax=Streptomyces nodosus TaxID=40318 RepID=A0A0B5DE13_9ACTN|nr:DUF2797 domain-containing protein [Streptomyces nodosus]AJE41459.1 hypothetical protein SNOD_16580 [Streptomyces nodosus]MBB4792647.1 hypothetical protein [Streptomyces nodosus]QEV40000.1 DUF2797 domain-containing protein [Streptomyces nodosus]
MTQVWRCTGVRWGEGGPVLGWEGGRRSGLERGKRVAFGVLAEGVRTCVGARGHGCPVRAEVPGRSTGARCEECARLDRAHSVAADGVADDLRPYRVYLAWFGPGMVKVGITAAERGSARLLEQGAVCFSWLGRGPLMAARRTEELLRAALRVPDRIPYADKRAVRAVLPSAEERAAETGQLHARAVALANWPESLERLPFRAVDHAGVFGLDGLPGADGVVSELAAGCVLSGAVLAAAGPDLHLATGGGVLVLDTRLMTGWELTAADRDEVTVPLRKPRAARAAQTQDGLF